MLSKPKSAAHKDPAHTRERLVQAAIRLILQQGFPATTVDQICAEAGVTKGCFFHYFKNKDAIGEAAANAWGEFGTALYAEAWKDPQLDPLEQLHRFFDIMEGFTDDPSQPCTCVVGIMSQELALSHPQLRDCCARHLQDWTQNTTKLLAAAKAKYPPLIDFDETQVAWFLNSLWQGSMLIAKTCQDPALIRTNLRIARECLDRLFGRPPAASSALQAPSLPPPEP